MYKTQHSFFNDFKNYVLENTYEKCLQSLLRRLCVDFNQSLIGNDWNR